MDHVLFADRCSQPLQPWMPFCILLLGRLCRRHVQRQLHACKKRVLEQGLHALWHVRRV